MALIKIKNSVCIFSFSLCELLNNILIAIEAMSCYSHEGCSLKTLFVIRLTNKQIFKM